MDHSPDTFSSIRLACLDKIRATSTMKSIRWSNDVDQIKTTINWYLNSMVIIAVAKQIDRILFAYTHQAIFPDFEFVYGFEISQARAHEAQKMHFVPRGEYPPIRTLNLDFDNTER